MTDKSTDDFLASLAVLKVNLRSFHEGVRETYRVVATELRKLLCDGQNTLLPRVFSNVWLHKLHWTHILEETPSLAAKLQMPVPGELKIKDGQPHFRLRFASTKEQMSLDTWLDQPLLGPDLSVREFIRSVADKEGAHSDPKYNEALVQAKSVKYCSDESHIHCIVGIAEYVLEFLRLEPLQVVPDVLIRRTVSGVWEKK